MAVSVVNDLRGLGRQWGWWPGYFGLALLVAYSLLRIWFLIPTILTQAVPPDWLQLHHGAEVISSGGNPYDWDSALRFRWSPVAAWLLVPLTALGPVAWTAMQFGAVALLPTWTLRIATLLFWPFWQDVQAGNVMVFILLAGAWALRGNRYGIAAFLALTLLIPRPLMIPMTVWILWKAPEWRERFVFMLVVSLALANVWALDWFGALAASTEEIYPERWGPAVWFGPAGVALSMALGAFLTWQGVIGVASLMISPYWLVYYPLVVLWDFRGDRGAPAHG